MGGGVNQQVCENEIENRNAKCKKRNADEGRASCRVPSRRWRKASASGFQNILEDLYGPEIDLLLSEYIILAVLIVANN